ncbi:MAG TPA: MEDS domain-containing protein [Solirubrobacterales bacterium]|nr:MEDS domain-containing protein [Solirubrobacterales bacterium]
MRAHGSIEGGSGLGHDGHACWGFEDRQEFLAATLEFLADGLRTGQRLAYIGSEPVAEQRERLDPLGNVGALIDRGSLLLFELSDLYRIGEPVDPEAQVTAYLAATEAAIADGYSGLRVAAQVTDLVAEPETWDAHVRWESAADRILSRRSLSALCGYDRTALPPQLLADLAAVHPAANGCAGPAPFHLFGESGGLALTGEVDLFSSETFDRALGFACDGNQPVSLDLSELEFIDHRGVEILAAHVRHLAGAAGCTVRDQPPVVNRLCEILDLQL